MGAPIVKLQGIKKKYGLNVVLEGLDLELEPGCLYALLGRNGTGKSTLMRLLMRHEAYDSGSGVAFGYDMSQDLTLFNERIGFVSESILYQLPTLSVQGILDFHKSIREEWDGEYVAEALQILKIPVERAYAHLSRGQKMQMAFLTASAYWPRLLLLDEITSVLDAVARDYFLRKLRKHVDGGATVLVATNIISEVQQYLDRVILLQDKKVKFNSSLAELRHRFVRIQKSKDANHSIFSSKECVELGIGDDGTLSFIVPIELASGVPSELISRAAPTASDIFLFMSKVKE